MAKKKQTTDCTNFMQSQHEPIFNFIKTEKGFKILVGNNLVSNKTFESFAECEEYVKSKPYELMINTACLFMHLTNEQEKEQQKQ